MLKTGEITQIVDSLSSWGYVLALDAGPLIDKLIEGEAPAWMPRLANSLVGAKIHKELIEWARKVRDDPNSETRKEIHQFLVALSGELQHDPVMIARVETLKKDFFEEKDLQQLSLDAWVRLRDIILESADEADSVMRRKITEMVERLGERLSTDAKLSLAAEDRLVSTAEYLAANYSTEISSIVSETIRRWDAKEASDKIEFLVGKDLQFIRINGTMVGALAGLAIYTVSFVLFH